MWLENWHWNGKTSLYTRSETSPRLRPLWQRQNDNYAVTKGTKTLQPSNNIMHHFMPLVRSCVYLRIKVLKSTNQIIGLEARREGETDTQTAVSWPNIQRRHWKKTKQKRWSGPGLQRVMECDGGRLNSPRRRGLWDSRTVTKPCSRQETWASCCPAVWTDVCTKQDGRERRYSNCSVLIK